MARQTNRLTTRAVAAANEPGLYSDGGGLYLAVARGGSKSWIYRYMLRRRSRDMGLGGVDVVSLAEAREKALESRKLVKAGVDPIDARNAERARQAVDAASSRSFRECAERYIASHESGWRNPKHRAQWSNTLATYAYPVFGEVPVDGVDTGMVMEVIEPIWATKIETATRVRRRIEAILSSARVLGYRSGDNPAVWRGSLDQVLAKPNDIRDVRHHPALPYDEIGVFIVKLRDSDATAALGRDRCGQPSHRQT